jgi:hypothetical protein
MRVSTAILHRVRIVRTRPMASDTVAMVLAVNWPPKAPAASVTLERTLCRHRINPIVRRLCVSN